MGDPRKRKRSKAFFGNFSKKFKSGCLQELDLGMTGFLVTCSDREKQCMSEMLNVLTQYADEMYGAEAAENAEKAGDGGEKEEGAQDISQTLQRELAEMKQPHRVRRFQTVRSLARNVVFIRCSDEVNPVTLTHKILTDAQTSGELNVRFSQRLLPVSVVCRASIDDIKQKAPSVIDPQFHCSQSKSVTFAVAYKSRNNGDMKRDDVISAVAALVTGDGSFGHKVDLTSPELVVVVEVVKRHCLMSVVRDYHSLKKYNVHSIVKDKGEIEKQVEKNQGVSDDGTTHEDS